MSQDSFWDKYGKSELFSLIGHVFNDFKITE